MYEKRNLSWSKFYWIIKNGENEERVKKWKAIVRKSNFQAEIIPLENFHFSGIHVNFLFQNGYLIFTSNDFDIVVRSLVHG